MKIRKVKWNNHPILGSLELDFLNDAGQPYDTVLFAGENGVGKTSILETLSIFLNKGTFQFFEFIEYQSHGKILIALPSDSPNNNFYNIKDGGEIVPMHTDKSHLNDAVDNNPINIRFDGCVYSKARADFKTDKIHYSTTKILDTDKHDIDNEDNFTSLKQLIVDIENQDNSDYSQENKSLGQNPKSWPVFFATSRIYRFSNAFDNFFDKLKYDKVADAHGEKTIYFKKNNISVSIDNLSTGEKQIVFRGAYLLKNIKNLANAVVMIDEPELSMHPKWQKNILNYYKELFSVGGALQSQLFFSTHSEHVLNNALSNKTQNIVIVLKDDNGVITSKKIDAPAILPSITNAETNFLAFDILSTDYHIELYGYMQQKFSLGHVKNSDEFIKNNGHYNAATHQKIYNHPNGTTVYNTLPTYIRNVIDHPDNIYTYNENELKTSTELLIEICR